MSQSSKTVPSHEIKAVEAKIKLQISRRATLFQRVQQAYALIDTIQDPKVAKLFMARCRDLEETRNEFSELVDTINELEISLRPDKEINHQALSSFDDLYYPCVAAVDDLKLNLSENNSPSNHSLPSSDTVRLPRIELQTFDGSLEKFTPWYNLFSSVINKSNIPPVQKLLYLQSSLIGEPLNLIKHLPVTDDNYSVAVDILLDRYNSKRKLASNYVDKLLNMEPLKSESYSKLRLFHENLTEQYLALEALRIPNLSDFILFHITFRNLDPATRKAFESHFKDSKNSSNSSESSLPSDNLPTFKQLLDFLGSQCKILEVSNLTSISNPCQRSSPSSHRSPSDYRSSVMVKAPRYVPTGKQNYNNTNNKNKLSYLSTSHSKSPSSVSPTCPICSKGSHTVYTCPQFRSLSVPERRQRINSLDRCQNCLGNHLTTKCNSKSKCMKCNGSHHSLLHLNDPSSSNSNNEGKNVAAGLFSSLVQNPDPFTVLLGTAVVHVQDASGGFIESRMLVDSGSQSSFLSKRLFNKLNLPFKKSDISITGLGQTNVTQRKAIASVTIKPCHSSTPLLSTQVIIMENLSGLLPACPLPDRVKNSFSHLPLADPNFTEAAPIDGIIGAELFPTICEGSPQPGGPGLPSALPSIFGWIIMGPVTSSLNLSTFIAEVSLEQNVKRFWEIEEAPSPKIVDPEEEVCEKLFQSHARDKSGRYIVPLLLKENASKLGGSFGYARRCLLSTERRLAKNPELKEAYYSFMRDYETTGHMRKVNISPSETSFFIPHHAVINLHSSTTKTRVVFNGSAPSDSGLSLNDVLHTGPKLQQDIVSIILGFRFYQIAFTADICKMYRQIKVLPDQTKFQRILWRYSPEDPISVYELTVVTWGLRSSSYLACRSLLQLAKDEATSLPRVSEVIKNETYIDDVITGASSVSDALKLQSDLVSVFSKGGFHLRKWSSNSDALLSSVPSEHLQTPLSFDSFGAEGSRIMVLGLQWNPVSDEFSYRLSPLTLRLTKRDILSDISKLYDPMGWLSPVILSAKSIIQRLWVSGVGWDDPIPKEIQKLWKSFVCQFSHLAEVKIPRYTLGKDKAEYHLLGFSDASEKGYAAVLYLHVLNSDGSSLTRIVMAKTKVAPLKSLSIPRLELCASLLLSKIFQTYLPLLTSRINISSTLAFTDSSVVLAWLRTPPYLLKQFVANRVVEITSVLSPSQWHHVRTEDNPADCASRGLMPQSICSHPLWFSGPPWLNKPKAEWPINQQLDPVLDVPELKTSNEIFVAQVLNPEESFIFTRYSSLQRLIRITAWLLRTRDRLRSSSPNVFGPLTTEELQRALFRLVELVQAVYFKDELKLLRKGQCSSRLNSLSPFLDPSGLLRVGGRLSRSNLPYSTKHPLLLPKKCSLTNLIIDCFHIRNMHVGPRALQAIIHKSFWIISSRQVIRSRLSKCLTCFRDRSKIIQPLMSDLPLSRVKTARPFLVVGTDYGGPFFIRESSRRKAIIKKAYLCLFVCFTSKAIHLEAVSDLSTEAFLAAFDRFTSRRGVCRTVYSDNGTNYVGANRYLSDLEKFLAEPKSREIVHNHFTNNSIKWIHSCPAAPHFGGIYEAGIKSAKHLLRKVIGNQVLNFEQLATVFTKVEAVLNSRPLCPLSNDPSELAPLTPGHLLIGDALNAVPEEDITDVPLNRLSQWQLLRQIYQRFWQMWRCEYLHTLIQRHKWTDSPPNLKVGDLVLLRDSRVPPRVWPIGRIEAVHPGLDGIVRVVTLKTINGSFQRPVVKLAPLPQQD